MRSHSLVLSLMLLVATSFIHLPAARAQSPIQERHKLEKENAELKTRVEALEEENANLRAKLAASAPQNETPSAPTKTSATRTAGAKTENANVGFGKTRWGMSPKEVKQHYPKLKKEGEYYAQEYSISGVDGFLAFDFHEGKLVRVFFISNERYTNDNAHLSDFDTLAGLLEKKYGAPGIDNITWDNDLYRDDPSSYGMAVSVGHLKINKGWDQGNTRVGLLLSGQNFKVSLSLVYMDLEGIKKQDAAEEDAILDEL